MPSSTSKKIVLYRFDRQPLEAVVNPSAYLLADHVEFITLDGNLQNISYGDVKAICFTSEVALANLFSENSLFEHRPKMAGLWTRFVFRDGDRLDGVLPHNLPEWPREGYLITPPRAGASRQRVFIPRAALAGTELRGVVGAPARRTVKPAAGKSAPDQLTMFE